MVIQESLELSFGGGAVLLHPEEIEFHGDSRHFLIFHVKNG